MSPSQRSLAAAAVEWFGFRISDPSPPAARSFNNGSCRAKRNSVKAKKSRHLGAPTRGDILYILSELHIILWTALKRSGTAEKDYLEKGETARRRFTPSHFIQREMSETFKFTCCWLKGGQILAHKRCKRINSNCTAPPSREQILELVLVISFICENDSIGNCSRCATSCLISIIRICIKWIEDVKALNLNCSCCKLKISAYCGIDKTSVNIALDGSKSIQCVGALDLKALCHAQSMFELAVPKIYRKPGFILALIITSVTFSDSFPATRTNKFGARQLLLLVWRRRCERKSTIEPCGGEKAKMIYTRQHLRFLHFLARPHRGAAWELKSWARSLFHYHLFQRRRRRFPNPFCGHSQISFSYKSRRRRLWLPWAFVG